ncbi:MAG TPA: glycine oxidase ThiO [Solirubrobacteraceae bacterium]|nr:glycine oxidase ThiO [Solirubrobacteraceae bacterium]
MPNRSTSSDVVVVGAGAVGLAVAWRAAQRGLRVTVLERADRPGAGTSAVAAGMLAPISETIATELPLMRLGLASVEVYPDFVEELGDASGVDPGYLRCGTLLAARDGDEAEALGRELELRQSLGLAVHRLRSSEARRLEPALAPALRLALEIPDDHAIDPRKLTAALARALTTAGGKLRTGATVGEVTVSAGRIAGVRLADGEDLAAEHVVVAAGAWTEALRGLPAEAGVPIHPVKGQILRLHDPAGPGLLTRVLRMTGGYLVPRGDGRYVLGATMEERGFDTTVTAGGAFELLRDAFELLPSVTELVIDELSAGLRPATPDNAPAIGPGSIPGLHWAVGHYRHGILLTPITAELVVGALADERTIPDEFAPARFAGVPAVAA